MDEIINKWKKCYNKILFIIGEQGSANKILKEFSIITIDFRQKYYMNTFYEIFNKKNICMMFDNKLKKALFIDDFNNYNINIENLNNMIKYNIPIIIIINKPLQLNIYKYINKHYLIDINHTYFSIYNITKTFFKNKNINNSIIKDIIYKSNFNLNSINSNINNYFNYPDIFNNNNNLNINNIITKQNYTMSDIELFPDNFIIMLHLLDYIIDENITPSIYSCINIADIYNNLDDNTLNKYIYI